MMNGLTFTINKVLLIPIPVGVYSLGRPTGINETLSVRSYFVDLTSLDGARLLATGDIHLF